MDLKELLGEELYKQVTEKAGDNKIAVVSDGNYIPKDKFDAVNKEKNDYKKQVSERDTQLEELKKVDAEGLQAKIDELQQTNETQKTEYEDQLQQQQFDFALKDALSGAKVKNPKAVKALLDTEKIKLDGETLLGLDDQLKAIKESDPYMFEEDKQEPGKPSFTTGQHQTGGGNGDPSNLQEALAQHFTQQN
ncbi:phage scaffolding protein [Virgibacillus halodenitrificans]|uniref:phage scaffolding protein n=1 Tax=Virgibacillus halodenitrificans TaxID=1482 RepID=UPI0002D3E648|nr:phage scaffolding protein [Virgibacillus halodenitrificans]